MKPHIHIPLTYNHSAKPFGFVNISDKWSSIVDKQAKMTSVCNVVLHVSAMP